MKENKVGQWFLIGQSRRKEREPEEETTKGLRAGRMAVGMALMTGFAFLMPITGFVPDCLLFLVLYGYLLGERRILFLGICSFAVTLLIYMIFHGIFGILLPEGIGIFARIPQLLGAFWPF